MLSIFGVISQDSNRKEIIENMFLYFSGVTNSKSRTYKYIESSTIALCYYHDKNCSFYKSCEDNWTFVYGDIELSGLYKDNIEENIAHTIHCLIRNETILSKSLYGKYIIISVDEKNQKYYFFRDNMGFYSMYFSQYHSQLLFASKIAPLIATKKIDKEIDLFSVYSYIYMKGVPREHTMFKNINNIPPGYCLSLSKGKLSLEKYKDILIQPPIKQSLTECANEIIRILGKQMSQIMTHGSKQALLLSGGLDSSFLLVLMKTLGVPFAAYTVIFDKKPDFAQETLAITRKLKKAFGIDIHYPCLDGDFVYNNIHKMMKYADVPFAGGFQTYTGLLAAQQNEGIPYLITGEGADVGLGLNRYTNILNKIKYLLKIIPLVFGERHFQKCKEFETKFRNVARSRLIEIPYQYAQFHSGYINWKATGLQLERVSTLFKNYSEAQSYEVELRKIHINVQNMLQIDDYYIKDIYKTLRTYSAEQAIRPFSNLCSIYNTEIIFPFLNEKYLQYALRIPVTYKKNKLILERAFQILSRCPDIQFKKRAFEMPMDSWLRGKLKYLAYELYNETKIKQRGLFNKVEINNLFNEYYNGNDTVSSSDIWALVTLEIWLQEHYDRI